MQLMKETVAAKCDNGDDDKAISALELALIT